MGIVAERRRFSVDEYHRLASAGVLAGHERVELVEGELIVMAPIGSLHLSLVTRLDHAFQAAASGRFVVSVQNPIALPPASEPQPDIALLRPRPDGYSASLPSASEVLLLIEVADTTLAYDRDVKIPLYGRHGVSEAWLLDAGARRIELYRDPGPDGYRTLLRPDRGAVISPLALPTLTIDLATLFAGIA